MFMAFFVLYSLPYVLTLSSDVDLSWVKAHADCRFGCVDSPAWNKKRLIGVISFSTGCALSDTIYLSTADVRRGERS